MIFAKKSLGQNFLHDQNIINKIINILEIRNRNILEIGPGNGSLTEKIIKKKPRSIILIEKDTVLFNKLREKYEKYNFIKIYNLDVLKIKIEKIIKEKTIIFGNLPYNISSQILIKLIKFNTWPPKYSDLILMFQKEVADKIIGKSYGRLSIISNYRLNFKNKFDISPNCFFPKPKVISTLIHLKPSKRKKIKIKRLENLEKITNLFFSNKRKMINKNLKKVLNKSQLNNIKNLDLKKRPTEYGPSFYFKVVELFENK